MEATTTMTTTTTTVSATNDPVDDDEINVTPIILEVLPSEPDQEEKNYNNNNTVTTTDKEESSNNNNNYILNKLIIDMGFPSGLANELLNTTRFVFPIRYWILDNSGSMLSNDGKTTSTSTKTTTTTKQIQCTRWFELTETVNYHSYLAGQLQATTIFRMLNDPVFSSSSGSSSGGGRIGIMRGGRGVGYGKGSYCGQNEFSIAEQYHPMMHSSSTTTSSSVRVIEEEVRNARDIMRQCQP